MYYLKIISLNGCPYSEAIEQLVKNNKIDSKIININQYEKEKYKSEEIDTFPQVFLNKKYSSGNLFIGGYSKLKSYYDMIHSSNKINFDSVKTKIKKDNPNLSDKSILRIIQLISNKI